MRCGGYGWSYYKVKVKVTLEEATKAQMGSSHIYTLSLTSALDGSELTASRLGCFTPWDAPVYIV